MELIDFSEDFRFGDRDIMVANVKEYLQRYGYFEDIKRNKEQEKNLFDGELQDAILRFQRQHGLPGTGTIDSNVRWLMRKRRCGVPDTLELFPKRKWTNSPVTYRFDSMTKQVKPEIIRKVIKQAFQTWDTILPTLTFEEVPNGTSADVSISWRRITDGQHGEVAQADFPPIPQPKRQQTEIVHLDFDEAEIWCAAYPEYLKEIDILTTAIHEIGHLLGLRPEKTFHSSNLSSVMYSTYLWPKHSLHPEDIELAQAHYGSLNP